jgi:hypothetical protein
MITIRAIKRTAIRRIAPTVFRSLTANFAWNATRGDQGLKTHAIHQKQLVAAQQEPTPPKPSATCGKTASMASATAT